VISEACSVDELRGKAIINGRGNAHAAHTGCDTGCSRST
jgi:hypothetical protein